MSIDTAVHIHVDGISRLLFDKRELKAAYRRGGAVVRKEARRLISSRAVSNAGQFPGYDSGAMSKSITVKVGLGGGYVKIAPQKTGKYFYPAFLIYGTSRGLKKRKDFMLQALDNKQSEARAMIIASLQNALKAI